MYYLLAENINAVHRSTRCFFLNYWSHFHTHRYASIGWLLSGGQGYCHQNTNIENPCFQLSLVLLLVLVMTEQFFRGFPFLEENTMGL